METLVATVLIVVVFMISSLTLNNVFSNTIKNSTKEIDAHVNELQYLYKHDKLTVPYQDDIKDWHISVDVVNGNGPNTIVIEAINTNTEKNITKTIRANQK